MPLEKPGFREQLARLAGVLGYQIGDLFIDSDNQPEDETDEI